MELRRRKPDSRGRASIEADRDQSRSIRHYEPAPGPPGLAIDREADVGRARDELVNAARYVLNTRALAGEPPLPRRIGVTSSIPGEGTTSVSHALATVLTEDFDAWVCWVDLSWARESPPRSSSNPGLFDLFTESIELADAFGITPGAGYAALQAGKVPRRDRHTLIRAAGFETLLSLLDDEFDYVVFDMPPVIATNAGLPAFSLADAYLLVAHSGLVREDQVERSVEQLGEIPHLGTVLNQQSDRVPGFFRRMLIK